MKTRRLMILTAVLVTIAMSGTAVLTARGHGAKRPEAKEFGAGPRTSAQGLYVATLTHPEPLKSRRMYAFQVSIADAAGNAVEEATIGVDGGMPQHGHGYPTRPRVTANLGGGSYEISGVRFNMGGWWELTLTITAPLGTDTVTFNLDI